MPLSHARLVRYERLVAPAEHRGLLIEPDAERIYAALREATADGDNAPLLDTTLGALRRALRGALGLRGPAIVSGHQAEFVHAGVFAKIIAAHELAARLGGEALFLTVDSDVPKATQVGVPQVTPHGLRRIDVNIPGLDAQLPFESQAPRPRAEWLQFFASLTALAPGGDRSLLPSYARGWLTTEAAAPDYCTALARAQQATEAALELGRVREVRMSALCATPAFRCWLAAFALDGRRVAEAYNAAQAAYRVRHKVRAAGRPVPPLILRDDTVELPFWVLRPGEPRRRLFATARGDAVELATDNRRVGVLPRADLARHAFHAEPWPLERDGWAVRPRALTLSAFARLFLADLFIHGIGGAKYDELMEEFCAAWLGVEPRPLCCVTATLYLPLPQRDVQPAELATSRAAARDLRWNPQRHLASIPAELLEQRAELVRRSDELRQRDGHNRNERRLVFRALRQIGEQILAADPWRVAEYDQRIGHLESELALNRIAREREYFYALHAPEEYARLRAQIRAALTP
jgi:hypothetical protein